MQFSQHDDYESHSKYPSKLCTVTIPVFLTWSDAMKVSVCPQVQWITHVLLRWKSWLR